VNPARSTKTSPAKTSQTKRSPATTPPADDPNTQAPNAQDRPRRYRSTRREQQAAQTRRDVLMAAVRCFASSGWSGTTMGDIAAEAGVAVETIYSGFGSKKQLLRAAMDVAIVGDTEPVPVADRPEYAAMGVGTVDERIRAGMRMQGAIHERSAAVWLALRDAATSDDDVAAWCDEMERARREELGHSLELSTGRRLDDDELDLLWALLGPEVYLKLVRELGWSRERYEEHLAAAGRKLLG
jgi:AcrR family transcriptional regulator